jgi:hypothetical protein
MEKMILCGRDLMLHAKWTGNEDIKNQTDSIVVDVVDAPRDTLVIRLQGSMALRIFSLMCDTRKNWDLKTSYNCFNAVRRAVGKEPWDAEIFYMEPQGAAMYVQDGLHRFPTPFVFQINGTFYGMNRYRSVVPNVHGAMHAGLILGKDGHGDLVGFDKFCHHGDLFVRPWRDIESIYFSCPEPDWKDAYVTCLPCEDVRFAEPRPEWDLPR